jgi:ABC-type dipeptide/oligopeptide/nickel transport system permease subunit
MLWPERNRRGQVPHDMGLVLFPGFAIMLTGLAVNLVDDSLRDLLDPRMRGVR